MPDGFSPLAQWGIPGFIIATLAATVAYLYRESARKDQIIRGIQSQRVEDAKETLNKITIPLESISQTINLLYDKIRASKEG